MRSVILLLPLLSSFCWGSVTPPLTYMLVATENGAQTQIDINHTSYWYFTPAVSWELKGGSFVMKDGKHTTADTVFSLYENGGASPVIDLTLTNAEFKTQNTSDQSFSAVNYLYLSLNGVAIDGFMLHAHSSYHLALTSSAPDEQSEAYFIKGGNFNFEDPSGNPINPTLLDKPVTSNLDTSNASAAPEPGTWAMFAIGVAAVAWGRRRAGKRAA